MKINCPLVNSAEVDSLVRMGADFFYAGLSSEIIFGTAQGISSRRPWKAANFSSLDDFRKACFLVHEYDKKISLVINEHFYTDEQIIAIVNFIRANYETIDAYIVADLGLILVLKKEFNDIDIIISTGAHVQNKNSIKFFNKIGVQKIVIPRHFSMTEIEKMTKEWKDIRFECFVYGGDCANIDGLCRFTHGIFDCDKINNACNSMYNFSIDNAKVIEQDLSEPDMNNIVLKLKNYNNAMFNDCGLCALWEMSRINIDVAKVISRETPLKQRLRYIFLVKKALSYVHLPKKEYIAIVQLFYKKIFGRHCGNRCLYRD